MRISLRRLSTLFFFFNDTATTEIYTLSLHDALPIYVEGAEHRRLALADGETAHRIAVEADVGERRHAHQHRLRRLRSEEHTSELQSPDHLVCRLLLEKKKTNTDPEKLQQQLNT